MIHYKEVSKIIEDYLIKLEDAKKKTILPEKVDKKIFDDLLIKIHEMRVGLNIGRKQCTDLTLKNWIS